MFPDNVVHQAGPRKFLVGSKPIVKLYGCLLIEAYPSMCLEVVGKEENKNICDTSIV